MNFKINNGTLTILFKNKTVDKGLRIQLYWPKIQFTNKPVRREIFLTMATVFRIVYEANYFGIGAEILGFGIGGDYMKKEPK